jgi:hypothetical protein
LRNLRKRGRGPQSFRIGRFVRYTDRAIRYFIDECRASGQTPGA